MRARGQNLRRLGCRIRFDLTDSDTSLLLDGTGGESGIEEAAADAAADTVLELSSDDLAGLIAGRLRACERIEFLSWRPLMSLGFFLRFWRFRASIHKLSARCRPSRRAG